MLFRNRTVFFNTITWFAFLTSTSTFLCCVLPMVFVFIGFGTTLTTITMKLPWLSHVGDYKFIVFVCSAILLLIVYTVLEKFNNMCPADPQFAQKCYKTKKFNKIVIFISMIIWLIGFIFAYIALPSRKLIEYTFG